MMKTSITWIQPHSYGAIVRHISNTVISFLCSSINYLENQLLPNDLIILRNHGDDEEDEWDIKRALERQEDPIQFRIPEFDFESNSESRTTLALN
jgi:hypothetical protein